MKRMVYLLSAVVMVVGLTLSFPTHVFGTTLIFEDFESDLSQWTGGHGLIVSDPLEPDHALTFTGLNQGGDIWTTDSFSSATGNYILSFDYLGTCGYQGCGGFIGYDVDQHYGITWLAGTGSYPVSVTLPDTGQWEHVSIAFSAPLNIYLTIEDWAGSGGTFGDAFFDNILLTDESGPTSPVPEPSTMLLLGSGLAGLAGLKRRFKK